MNRKYLALTLILPLFFSCNSNTATTAGNAKGNGTMAMGSSADAKNSEAADSARHAELNKLKIANADDPSCGMPMLRGFDDTTMYEGKLIGFCSKECKDKFLKDPSAHKIKYN